VDKRLQNKNERAINKRNVDLIIAREEAKIKKRQMKDRTGNPKIDGPLEDFEKVYGYKIGSKFDEKINAMKDGGDVSMPKRRPKNFKKTVEKQKKERAVAKGKVTVGGLNEMTDYDKEQFLKSKKMKLGGEAVPSKFKGFSKLPEGVQQKIDPKLASKYEMGGKVKEYGGGGKVKGGKMTCRGMGAAVKGGGFSIS